MIDTHLDALGNEIVQGQKYGFTHNKSGLSCVTLGIASHVKNGKVRLVECETKTFIYDKMKQAFTTSGDLSIRTFMVFPIKEQK